MKFLQKHTLVYMFLISFLIQYFFMPILMTDDSFANITYSLGKFYLATIMGLIMVLTDLIIMEMTNNKFYIFILTLVLFLFIYLYRFQVFVTKKEYVKEMIEHHSMALFTSKKVIENSHNNSDDDNIINLASNIINNQEKEIAYMKSLIYKSNSL
jgi:hypothetical protein